MPQKENRKRAYHPKSRTGCWSCRSRKVKCDEGKPGCQRCRNYGMRCAGYATSRPMFSAYCSLIENESKASIQRPPSIPLMSSMLQEQYFNIYFTKTRGAIRPYFGPSDNEIEARLLIMETCNAEPALFHAIVAVGALEKTCDVVRIDKAAGFSTANPHHEFALKEYGKAIKMMRKTTEDGLRNLRNLLLITVFIILFEDLHGNCESSTAQIPVALKMIEGWKAITDAGDKHGSGFSSPAPYEIPDMLLQIFGRLEIQTMLFVDPRPREIHAKLKTSGTEAIRCMPESFSSVEEARIYLDLIMRRIMHWMAQIGHNVDSQTPPLEAIQAPSPNSELPLKKTFVLHPPNSGGTIKRRGSNGLLNPAARAATPLPRPLTESSEPTTRKRSPNPPKGHPNSSEGKDDGEDHSTLFENAFWGKPICSDDHPFLEEVYEEQNAYVSELYNWLRAFNPLYTISPSQTPAYTIGLPLLKVQYLLSYIILQAKLSPSEMIWEVFTAEFTEALALCESVLERLGSSTEWANSSLHFTFDYGVLIPLYLIMTKCRISHLRKCALHLTLTNQRREGNWDSELTAAVAAWVIRLEEEGMLEDGTVPEKARISQVNLKTHLEKRRAVICCQRWEETAGKWVLWRDEIYW